MPTYEYKCKDHGHIFEVEQKMSDPPLTNCEICGAEVESGRPGHPILLIATGGSYENPCPSGRYR